MSELARGLARRQRAINEASGTFLRYRSLEAFAECFDGNGMLGSIDGKLPLDFKFNPSRGSTTLSVFFNSQQSGDELKLFTWQNVSLAMNSNRLFISDPSLYASPAMRVGWYFHARDFDIISACERLIRRIASSIGARRIVFFGSSGGAFPAAVLNERFYRSVGVLVCPALTVEKNPNSKALDNWLEHCALTRSVEEFKLAHSTATMSAWNAVRPDSRSHRLIIHNRSDDKFFRHHISPYIEVCEKLGLQVGSDELSFLEGEWGLGHKPPPASELSRLLGAVARYVDGAGASALRSFEFHA